MESFGKAIVFAGLLMVFVGMILILIDKLPFGLGKLPGDIYIKRDNFVFYFPLATSLILSIVVSLILFVVSRMSR